MDATTTESIPAVILPQVVEVGFPRPVGTTTASSGSIIWKSRNALVEAASNKHRFPDEHLYFDYIAHLSVAIRSDDDSAAAPLQLDWKTESDTSVVHRASDVKQELVMALLSMAGSLVAGARKMTKPVHHDQLRRAVAALDALGDVVRRYGLAPFLLSIGADMVETRAQLLFLSVREHTVASTPAKYMAMGACYAHLLAEIKSRVAPSPYLTLYTASRALCWRLGAVNYECDTVLADAPNHATSLRLHGYATYMLKEFEHLMKTVNKTRDQVDAILAPSFYQTCIKKPLAYHSLNLTKARSGMMLSLLNSGSTALTDGVVPRFDQLDHTKLVLSTQVPAEEGTEWANLRTEATVTFFHTLQSAIDNVNASSVVSGSTGPVSTGPPRHTSDAMLRNIPHLKDILSDPVRRDGVQIGWLIERFYWLHHTAPYITRDRDIDDAKKALATKGITAEMLLK